jgi:hypothetical protein
MCRIQMMWSILKTSIIRVIPGPNLVFYFFSAQQFTDCLLLPEPFFTVAEIILPAKKTVLFFDSGSFYAHCHLFTILRKG